LQKIDASVMLRDENVRPGAALSASGVHGAAGWRPVRRGCPAMDLDPGIKAYIAQAEATDQQGEEAPGLS
jgi:hypothetical protein